MIQRNLMGPYTKGVPSPYVAHVHPYPTRFHGAIYTRPVFGFPWVESPQAVFKPNDFTPYGDEGPDRMNGLGDPQYDTGRGVFRPGGRGGGIFDSTISGLGTLGATKKPNKKKKLSSALRGFGAVTKDSELFPWKEYSDGNLALQKATNVAIEELGYCPISEDGKLGPGTCGARQLAHDLYSSGMQVPDSCESFTKPKHKSEGCGGSSPSTTTTQTTTTAASLIPTTYEAPSSFGSNKTLWFALAGAATFGALYYWKKRKR
jgi:hypothetical protein